MKHRFPPNRGATRTRRSVWLRVGDKIGAHVLRGGSWYDRPQDIRLGFRHFHAAGYRLNVIGFRLALDPR